MTRLIAMSLIGIGLCACAQSRTDELEREQVDRIVIETQGERYVVERSSVPTASSVVDVRAADAWQSLSAIYEQLEIPIETYAAAEMRLGSNDFTARRSLGGQRLSTYLDCGSDMTGRRANSYRLQLGVLTQVEPMDPDSSRLTTRITATGESVTGVSGTRVNCRSTGVLENLIASMVARRAGSSDGGE